MPKKYFFTKIFDIYSFIDDCYELKSYERGVAQLGSAGALGAHFDTSYIQSITRVLLITIHSIVLD